MDAALSGMKPDGHYLILTTRIGRKIRVVVPEHARDALAADMTALRIWCRLLRAWRRVPVLKPHARMKEDAVSTAMASLLADTLGLTVFAWEHDASRIAENAPNGGINPEPL